MHLHEHKAAIQTARVIADTHCSDKTRYIPAPLRCALRNGLVKNLPVEGSFGLGDIVALSPNRWQLAAPNPIAFAIEIANHWRMKPAPLIVTSYFPRDDQEKEAT